MADDVNQQESGVDVLVFNIVVDNVHQGPDGKWYASVSSVGSDSREPLFTTDPCDTRGEALDKAFDAAKKLRGKLKSFI